MAHGLEPSLGAAADDDSATGAAAAWNRHLVVCEAAEVGQAWLLCCWCCNSIHAQCGAAGCAACADVESARQSGQQQLLDDTRWDGSSSSRALWFIEMVTAALQEANEAAQLQ
jgi:hypothetical protein